MKIFLIERTDDVGYDHYDSAVVAAIDVEAARNYCVGGKWGARWASWCKSPEEVAVTYLGEYALDVPEDAGNAFIILGSFNAG
jgi:hypothetical protein